MKHFKHTFFDFGIAIAIAGLVLAGVAVVTEFYL
jgi:hypothetical protein